MKKLKDLFKKREFSYIEKVLFLEIDLLKNQVYQKQIETEVLKAQVESRISELTDSNKVSYAEWCTKNKR